MMNNKRIDSVLKSENIGVLPSDIKAFNVSDLKIDQPISYLYNSSLRLGKAIEKVFSACVNASSNYKIIQENTQIQDGKITLGELDFVLEQTDTKQLIHLELVYKFYVYDSDNSKNELGKWIGPNRKDSFTEKLTKLTTKQFPFLYHPITKKKCIDFNVNSLEQRLCFMVNLFVPFAKQNITYPKINNKAIVGFWLNLSDFNTELDPEYNYYLPQKSEWGIDPKNNTIWNSKTEILLQIKAQHQRQFSPLCWIKKPNLTFKQCFVVWW